MTTGFDIGLTAAQLGMQSRLHAVARDELRPLAAEAERDGLDPKQLAHLLDAAGIAPAALLEHGVDDVHTLLVALEELAYGDAGIAWAAVPALALATVVAACGSPAQRASAREVLADGRATSAVLLYEDFGRQPSEYETRVTASADGATVSGHKSSVSYPAGADLSLVVGREGDEPAAFCFAGARAGVTADRDDRETGKIGVTAVPSGPVSLDAVALTGAERLGGGIALHHALGQARLLLAACLVGLARASLEFAAAYATQRTTWGKPLAEHQGVSFPLIELTTEVSEVRLLLWDVAARLPQLDDVDDVERRVTRAVNRASSVALRATRNGVQLVGVRGISRDLPCERWYREAAVLAAIDFDLLQTPFGLS